MVDAQADRHGDQRHARRAGQHPDLARSVLAAALGQRRARRPRQRRRQRDRPAVELRLEGHAAAGRGLDDGRRRDHRHDARPARRRPTSTTTTSTRSTSSTAGQAITQQTGGPGLNFVVKRGTNLFHGSAHSYFDNDAMEASNVPAELAAKGVTPDDGGSQRADLGLRRRSRRTARPRHGVVLRLLLDAGRAARAPQRHPRRSDAAEEPEPEAELAGDAKDMVSFLYFDGFKIKDNRSPGTSGITFDAPTATFHQDNAYTDNPLHGLFKIADDRVIRPNMFLTAKYAYYNTGFLLTPEGGMGLSSGRDLIAARVVRIDGAELERPSADERERRPQLVPQRARRVARRQVRLRLAPGERDDRHAVAGQRHPRRSCRTRRRRSRRCSAKAAAPTARTYVDVYVGDTISKGRATIDLGVRYDHQGGRALPSATAANPAFPTLVPGLDLRRLRRAVHLEQRLAARRAHLRARRVAQDRGCAPATRASPASSTRPASAT